MNASQAIADDGLLANALKRYANAAAQDLRLNHRGVLKGNKLSSGQAPSAAPEVTIFTVQILFAATSTMLDVSEPILCTPKVGKGGTHVVSVRLLLLFICQFEIYCLAIKSHRIQSAPV